MLARDVETAADLRVLVDQAVQADERDAGRRLRGRPERKVRREQAAREAVDEDQARDAPGMGAANAMAMIPPPRLAMT